MLFYISRKIVAGNDELDKRIHNEHSSRVRIESQQTG